MVAETSLGHEFSSCKVSSLIVEGSKTLVMQTWAHFKSMCAVTFEIRAPGLMMGLHPFPLVESVHIQ